MRLTYFIIFLLILSGYAAAGQDSLVFYNGNQVWGEIKSMERGVLTIETDYSKNDFTIEWSKVKFIKTSTRFFITLTNGDRVAGVIRSGDSTDVVISDPSWGDKHEQLSNIVVLKSGSPGLKDRIKASISVGYSVTKAQNAQQISVRSAISYLAGKWGADVAYNSVLSRQDEVQDVQRKDGGINYSYFLGHDWYLPATVSFLSNTEQLLELRLLAKGGVGKYVVRTNQLYWGISVGANYNTESYLDDTPRRRSWESFLGTELNLFDIGDLSLVTRVVGYPSLTESGRFRTDFSLDTKYDLPLDFYIGVGVTVNYDNRPIEGASDTDYVCQMTFGWKW